LSPAKFYLQLLLWCALYFSLGYISLFLDDPLSQVSFVWFPAGLAVAAFLLTPRRFWPPLFLGLFIVRTLLDVTMRHSLETSLVHSVISLGNDFAIAWLVRRFRRPDDMQVNVLIWLAATVVISAVAAAAGAGWVLYRHNINFVQTLWIWWSANVVGTILLTTIIMGLFWKPEPLVLRKCLTGGGLWIGLCLCAAWVFSQPFDDARSEALHFILACIPVMIMIAIPIASGNRLGALAFLSFSTIVIYCSWHRLGPLFIPGLRSGEPLLLAQCYLSGTALLLNFVYVLKRNVPGMASSYYLIPQSGRLTWDQTSVTPLTQHLLKINHADELLALLSPDDAKRMRARWETISHGGMVTDTFSFLIQLSPKIKIQLQETKLTGLPQPEGVVIIGSWSEELPNRGFTRTVRET
jgi:integral membrane sensor domain MASE1